MTSETRIRVRYAETDQMGVVYYANYLVWFEIGRIEHIRHLGLDYSAMEKEEGCGLPVVEAISRFKAPARFDEELVIRTRLGLAQGSIVSFDYAVHRAADDLVLCEGSTTHMVVDRAMKRAPMPPRYAEVFRQALAK
jgi:acyl-CoA thioester hydrolase